MDFSISSFLFEACKVDIIFLHSFQRVSFSSSNFSINVIIEFVTFSTSSFLDNIIKSFITSSSFITFIFFVFSKIFFNILILLLSSFFSFPLIVLRQFFKLNWFNFWIPFSSNRIDNSLKFFKVSFRQMLSSLINFLLFSKIVIKKSLWLIKFLSIASFLLSLINFSTFSFLFLFFS